MSSFVEKLRHFKTNDRLMSVGLARHGIGEFSLNPGLIVKIEAMSDDGLDVMTMKVRYEKGSYGQSWYMNEGWAKMLIEGIACEKHFSDR